MTSPILSRRAGLLGAAALSALPRTVRAAAPMAGRQAPGFHRIRVGRFEVTALLDGTLELGLEVFPAVGTEASALLERAFRPQGPVLAHVNAYAINTGERLYLIDTGTQPGFAPTVALLPEALAAAGIQPAQVDAVIATHLHPDHVGGLVRDGRAVYPNAELIVPEVEAGFWLAPDALSRAPAEVRPFFEIAQASVAPYAGRMRRLAPGAAPAPGIESVAMPGHTPGHTGYLVTDGGPSLLIWGDVIHAAPLQLPRPAVSVAFDVDGALAAATRARALDRAVGERLMVAGMHMPFPGFGHILREGAGYAFVPLPFMPL
ncbi:MBL fold metallo-hydrolase [Muricoccus radiodurans]|uniref:MBL fold metallo-hydrolase n=1 Tax=Muricoccus radiodurans TaxID=2231721 RepID=UPI003CFA482A